MSDENRKGWMIVGGLIALAVIFGQVDFSWVIGLAIFGALLYYANQDEREHPHTATQHYSAQEGRPANTDRVHPHALTAVREAGLNPDRLAVLPVDIGLMAYHGNDDPVLHRTWPIADDSDYIRPFVQLRVPQIAVGKVKFEVIDHKGEPVFVHEEKYQLERGRNLVIPAARLPLHDEQDMLGTWELRVYADGRLLAAHIFGWETSAAPDFDRHIGSDGEMNSELRAVLAESRLEQLSMDDLLAYQNEDDAQAAREG